MVEIKKYLLKHAVRMLGSLLVCASLSTTVSAFEGIRVVGNPPTHMGTLQGQAACNTQYHTVGFEPDDSEQHPVFLLFDGTHFDGQNPDPVVDPADPHPILALMAERGFVSLFIQYDAIFDLATFNETGFRNKLSCMFDHNSANSLISKVCALGNVDCSMGLSVGGHSQGAVMSLGSSQYDSRVRAAYVSGYSDYFSPRSVLPYNRVRMVNAELDNSLLIPNADVGNMNNSTGLDCSSQANSCLRQDGSGWVLVRQNQISNTADHCWFFATACDGTPHIEPTWWDASAPPMYDYSLLPNINWLVAAHAEGRACPSKFVRLQSQLNNRFVSARLLTTGIPVQATSFFTNGWETFACFEQGDGKIALRASNGKFVQADPANGYKLSATLNDASADATFELIDLGNGVIALKGVNGDYIGVDSSQGDRLISDDAAITVSGKYQVTPYIP